jgi:hypothetical protein
VTSVIDFKNGKELVSFFYKNNNEDNNKKGIKLNISIPISVLLLLMLEYICFSLKFYIVNIYIIVILII